jgi:phage/plasmid-associated DNA primase
MKTTEKEYQNGAEGASPRPDIDPEQYSDFLANMAALVGDQVHRKSRAEERRKARGPVELQVGDDAELAEYLVNSQMRDVVYAEGSFWRYERTHWKAIPDHLLSAMVRKLSGMPYGESGKVNISGKRIDSIIRVLADILTKLEFFEQASHGINAANCFISFRDGKLVRHAHSPDHRQRHTLPGRWEPGTPTTPPEGSLLATLLSGAFKGDPQAEAKIWFLQQIMFVAAAGYSTSLLKPKAVIFLGQQAENGKSQILDMAEGLLPADAVSTIPPHDFTDDNKILTLVGAALNTSGELSASAITGDRFKSVVTGDRLPARGAYARSVVRFRPQALHLFAGNKLPPFKGGFDRGVKRRLAVLDFQRVIPMEERIAGIGRRIASEEADLLLAWAFGAAEHILTTRAYEEPPCSEALVEEWTQTDAALGWIADRVLPTPSLTELGEEPQKSRIPSADVFRDFRAWYWAEEGKAPPLQQKAFTDRIKGQKLPGVRYISGSNGFRGFEGLCLATPTTEMRESPVALSPVGSVGRLGRA